MLRGIPPIQTVADLHQLAQTSPDQHRRYLELQAGGTIRQTRSFSAYRQLKRSWPNANRCSDRPQWNSFCAAEDATYEQAHPDVVKDQRTRETVNRKAMNLLRAEGFSDEQIRGTYNLHPSELAQKWPGAPVAPQPSSTEHDPHRRGAQARPPSACRKSIRDAIHGSSDASARGSATRWLA